MGEWLLPLGIVAVVVAVALVVRQQVIFLTRVTSTSMTPTLPPGRWVWAWRVHDPATIRRGDIVVVDSAEVREVIVKRAVGLPGDRVTVGPTGTLWVNDRVHPEPYVSRPVGPEQNFDVPEDHLLLMGDNREHSSDSRAWRQPYLPCSAVLGRVVRRASAAAAPREPRR